MHALFHHTVVDNKALKRTRKFTGELGQNADITLNPRWCFG